VTVRDKLGEDFEGCTLLVPPGLNVRVFIGSGALVDEFEAVRGTNRLTNVSETARASLW
jgi:hypothetical protein